MPAELDGGKKALLWTAIVPAIMAGCYLLLILFFAVDRRLQTSAHRRALTNDALSPQREQGPIPCWRVRAGISIIPFPLKDLQEQLPRLRRVPVHLVQELLPGARRPGRLAAEAPGQLLQVLRLLRQLVQRAVVDDAQPALDQAQEVVARPQRRVLARRRAARRRAGRRALPRCCGCAARAWSRPYLRRNICTRNSMSTMPPKPRFRSRSLPLASTRSRMSTDLVGQLRPPVEAVGGPADGVPSPRWPKSASPCTTRARVSACRSQSWAPPSS